MDFVRTLFDLLACGVAVVLAAAGWYHWVVKPAPVLPRSLNGLGVFLAIYGVLQAYLLGMEAFIAWYGGVKYEVFDAGKWYPVDGVPWLTHAISLCLVIAALLFWVPAIRLKPKWACIISVILLLSQLLPAFAPGGVPVPR